ncbi:MAG: rod-binding protein [Spirochaetes bacterium]|nr:rod-binding protein [Spirochaetota bacterium]
MINSINKLESFNFIKSNQDFIKTKSEISHLTNDNKNDFKSLLKEKIKKDGIVNIKSLNKNEKKLYNACIELESFFWKQVLNSMKKTINKYKLIDGGLGEDIFSDFLYDEYSVILAKNSKSKISDDMFKQLSKVL